MQASRATESLVGELLPVLDNLERALDASEHHEEAKVAEGVQFVKQQLAGLLARRGLEEIPCEPGDEFDPHVHEALSHQPSDQPEGAVAAVWQRGYRLGDRVVRAARVVVSSGPPAPRRSSGDALRDAGRAEGRERRRDQEGLPQARAPVPPRPQPRRLRRPRSGSRGSARRTRCSRIPRSESSTTRSARRSGPARARRAAASRASTSRAPGRGPGFDLGDIFGGLFNRGGSRGGGREAQRGADVEVQVQISFPDSLRGATVKVPVDKANAVHDLPRLGRRAGHVTHDLPRLQGARRHVREPGVLRDEPALRPLRRRGDGHRRPVPDLPRLRPAALDEDLPGARSRRASATAPASRCAARARPARAAASRATCTSSPAWPPARSSIAAATIWCSTCR